MNQLDHCTPSTVSGQRTIHLVDVDNLLGNPGTTDRQRIRTCLARYRARAGYTPGDHVIVATGCNGRHVLETELAWPAAVHRRRAGKDGADLALLDDLDWVIASGRYTRVVIGSGDHAFAPSVDRLLAANIRVDIVSDTRRLCRQLATAAPCHAL